MLKSTSQVKALSQWTSGCPRGCNAGTKPKSRDTEAEIISVLCSAF